VVVEDVDVGNVVVDVDVVVEDVVVGVVVVVDDIDVGNVVVDVDVVDLNIVVEGIGVDVGVVVVIDDELLVAASRCLLRTSAGSFSWQMFE